MNKKNLIKVARIGIAIAIVIIITIFLWKLLPFMKNLSTIEGQIIFKQRIESMGFKGVLLLFGLQVLQILLVVLPGEPLEIMAGMCFGTIGGTIFIMTTACFATALIFTLVRKFGRSYVEEFFKKDKLDKIENSKFFKESKNIEIVMTILFIIPGTPKDLLVYIGGLLPIKPMRFNILSISHSFSYIIS